ncbi:hypothetical protein B0H13DRAFT_1851310 [Mycena leptocephala]|nr:hypothetical protein B0H13DRAFT_1851310 [Mycena leptocephala]
MLSAALPFIFLLTSGAHGTNNWDVACKGECSYVVKKKYYTLKGHVHGMLCAGNEARGGKNELDLRSPAVLKSRITEANDLTNGSQKSMKRKSGGVDVHGCGSSSNWLHSADERQASKAQHPPPKQKHDSGDGRGKENETAPNSPCKRMKAEPGTLAAKTPRTAGDGRIAPHAHDELVVALEIPVKFRMLGQITLV